MQTHPRRDAGRAGGAEHLSVVGDGVLVIDALLRLDPGPFDGKPVVGQTQVGKQTEVLGEAGGEAVAVTRRAERNPAVPIPTNPTKVPPPRTASTTPPSPT